jgi:hypothetical protein
MSRVRCICHDWRRLWLITIVDVMTEVPQVHDESAPEKGSSDTDRPRKKLKPTTPELTAARNAAFLADLN